MMRQWYCLVGEQQYGPISEEVLRDWIQQGRIKPSDAVWTDGMAEWSPAGSVPGLFEGVAARPAGGAASPPAPPPGGTGGRSSVGEIISTGFETLRERWGLAIGFSLLLWLIQMGTGMVPFASLVLTGPLSLGAAVFFLTFIRRGQAEIGMLFAGFKNFASALWAYLLMLFFGFLWILLAALPGLIVAGALAAATREPDIAIAGLVLAAIGGLIAGIIVLLRYSQTFYVLADDPSIGALGAIGRSIEMMRGNKLRLFCLALLFFAGTVACGFVICVGWVFLLIFVMPFIAVCYARFYDDLWPPAGPAATPQIAGPHPEAPTPPTPHLPDNNESGAERASL